MRAAPIALLMTALAVSASACAPDAPGLAAAPTSSVVTESAALGGLAPAPSAPASSTTTSSTTTTTPAPRSLTIAVVGDSLTVAARDAIDAELTARGHEVVAIDAVTGRRMVDGSRDVNSGISAIDGLRADGVAPDLWVIALGTNDISTGVNAFEHYADELLTHLPDDADIVWMNLWVEGWPDNVDGVNTILSGRWTDDGVTIADWHTRASEPGLIVGDGIHLTSSGESAFAEVIADAVQTRAASSAP